MSQCTHSHQTVLPNPEWAIKYNIWVGLQTPPTGVWIAHFHLNHHMFFLFAASPPSPSSPSSDPTFPRCSWYPTLLLPYIPVQTGHLPANLPAPSTPSSRGALAWARKCRANGIQGKNLHLHHNEAKTYPSAGAFDR